MKVNWLIVTFVESVLLILLAAGALLLSQSGRAEPSKIYVDTQLVIAVDTSFSVKDDEYQTQKEGVVAAFSDPQIISLMRACNSRGVAVTYVEWSGSQAGEHQVYQVVPWTLISTENDIYEFQKALLAFSRTSAGETDLVSALLYAGSLLQNSPYRSSRKIISVSGDGEQSFVHGAMSVGEASVIASQAG
ncbi:MAG: DUF1194 domain-containing protein, partial [Pseudomonadota bacterium]